MTRTDTQQTKSWRNYGAKAGRWLADYAEDLLIVAGLGVIVYASFLVHRILGLYVLGAVMVGVGWVLARGLGGKRGGS